MDQIIEEMWTKSI